MQIFSRQKKDTKLIHRPYGRLYFGKIYRFMKIDGIIPSLENSTLRYKAPNEFNDPLDCSFRSIDIPYLFNTSFQRNKENFAKFLLLRLLQGFTERDNNKSPLIDDLKNFVTTKSFEDHIKNSPEIDMLGEAILSKIKNESDSLFKSFPSDYRICCFSKRYASQKSFLMWSHYADSHRGACFEFDFNGRLMDFLCKYKNEISSVTDFSQINEDMKNDLNQETIPFTVNYKREIPDFRIDNIVDNYKWLTTKSKIWNYEEEIRCITMQDPSIDIKTLIETGSLQKTELNQEVNYIDIPFPFKYLTKIIFGNLTTEGDINKIKHIVEQKYPYNNIRFEKMDIDPKTFNLTPKHL